MFGYNLVYCSTVAKKIKTSITFDEDLLKWIDSQIKTKRFASRTHALEYAVEQLKHIK
jgi:Arc/MetJ-type ribon-helix-helix transcriptional regulator